MTTVQHNIHPGHCVPYPCVPVLSQPPEQSESSPARLSGCLTTEYLDAEDWFSHRVRKQISSLVTYATTPLLALAKTDPYCRSTSGTVCWPTTQTTTAAASSWTGSSTPPAVSAGTVAHITT